MTGKFNIKRKYQMIYRISIILYRNKYCIEKIDRYPAQVPTEPIDVISTMHLRFDINKKFI